MSEPHGARVHRCGPRSSRGSATAELAAALPALILLLLFALGAVDAALARMRCVDAARSAALVSARGGDGMAAAGRTGPSGATVRIDRGAALVTVRVEVAVHPLGPHLPAVTVGATAVAEVEPGAIP